MLDIEQPGVLVRYLRDAEHIHASEEPETRVLGGGVSNRTVWLKRESGEAWVVKQALAQLRVQVEWFSDPQRIHCEATVLRLLGDMLPTGATPSVVFEDHANHILGMTAIPEPHSNWKTMMLQGQLALRHVEQFGTMLGTIHRWAAENLPRVEAALAECNFFESLRIEPYYLYSAAQVPEAAPFIQALVAETRAQKITLTHGDYSPKNVLIYADGLVLLDHEVAHIGDPAFDVGFSLTHLLSKAHHLPTQRVAFAQAAHHYWQAYQTALGTPPWFAGLEARAARHTLGCLLARVAGRSPLEYLDAAARARQQAVVLHIMDSAPSTIPELITRFIEQLDAAEAH
jgi:5-methylthioribose kinase